MPTDTKDRILDASGELFRRQGYTGTGVKEILAAASAPFGSLYHHFPGGKSELGAETVRRSGFLYGLLLGEYAGPEVPLAQGIRAFFDGAAENLEESDWVEACPIATVALEVSATDEEMRRACADVFEAWIAGGVVRFEAEGLPGDVSRALVIGLINALEGAFVLARAMRSREPLERAGDATVAAIEAALAAS